MIDGSLPLFSGPSGGPETLKSSTLGPSHSFARTHARNANTNTKHDFPVRVHYVLTPKPPIITITITIYLAILLPLPSSFSTLPSTLIKKSLLVLVGWFILTKGF